MPPTQAPASPGATARLRDMIGAPYEPSSAGEQPSSMQCELLDRQRWSSREQLGSVILEWIEGFYNPRRRHFGIGYLSSVAFEALHTAAVAAP